MTDGPESARLVFEKDGQEVRAVVEVDGDEVFKAEPRVERSKPVLHAAVRTFGTRGWPEMAEFANKENGGGAFQ